MRNTLDLPGPYWVADMADNERVNRARWCVGYGDVAHAWFEHKDDAILYKSAVDMATAVRALDDAARTVQLRNKP